MTKMLVTPPAAFKSEVQEHIRDAGPRLMARLSHWIQLSEEFNSGHSSRSRQEIERLTDFPLLPASQGFCLSLKKALKAFQDNMSKG